LCTLNPRWFPIEGEEAVVVGAFVGLRPDDAIAPHYRDPFAAYLMRGAEMWRLVAQVLGKPVGYNRGRSVPFSGPLELNIVPWVAGDLGTSIGVGTGAALAFQHAGSDRVCVCTFGDGTANRGDFHENLNLASVWRLPAVYVCQNNGWSISQRASEYVHGAIVDRAQGYGMPGRLVDGQDVDAVQAAVSEAVARARYGDGPTLIEATTHRVRGHWAGDVAAYRGENDAAFADPLDLAGHRLVARGAATEADLAALTLDVRREIGEAVEQARSAPDAVPADLCADELLV
jgi:pyruvate dehydrogenase E1 component alpha subunit